MLEPLVGGLMGLMLFLLSLTLPTIFTTGDNPHGRLHLSRWLSLLAYLSNERTNGSSGRRRQFSVKVAAMTLHRRLLFAGLLLSTFSYRGLSLQSPTEPVQSSTPQSFSSSPQIWAISLNQQDTVYLSLTIRGTELSVKNMETGVTASAERISRSDNFRIPDNVVGRSIGLEVKLPPMASAKGPPLPPSFFSVRPQGLIPRRFPARQISILFQCSQTNPSHVAENEEMMRSLSMQQGCKGWKPVAP